MTYFREVQPFTQNKLAWIVVVGVTLSVVVPLAIPVVRENMSGPLTATFALPLLAVVWFLAMRLETEVRDEGVHLRFRALWLPKTFAWEQIASAEAVTYRPILDYGGWGIRWGRAGRAWNVSGSEGVRLHLTNGKNFLIGSREAERLAAAIRERMSAAPRLGTP